jgi:hypothetical protein
MCPNLQTASVGRQLPVWHHPVRTRQFDERHVSGSDAVRDVAPRVCDGVAVGGWCTSPPPYCDPVELTRCDCRVRDAGSTMALGDNLLSGSIPSTLGNMRSLV